MVADSAIGAGLASKPQLTEQVQRFADRKGGRAAAAVVVEADGRAESAFESVSRYRLLRAGLPRPELQVSVGNYRVDFLWKEQRVIGEADGLAKYGTEDAQVRAKIRAERKRQRELEEAGYEIVRWLWDEIWHTPDVVAARIRRTFDKTARNPG